MRLPSCARVGWGRAGRGGEGRSGERRGFVGRRQGGEGRRRMLHTFLGACSRSDGCCCSLCCCSILSPAAGWKGLGSDQRNGRGLFWQAACRHATALDGRRSRRLGSLRGAAPLQPRPGGCALTDRNVCTRQRQQQSLVPRRLPPGRLQAGRPACSALEARQSPWVHLLAGRGLWLLGKGLARAGPWREPGRLGLCAMKC